MGKTEGRFQQFNIEDRASDPDETGLLPSVQEFDYGTPSLARQETITLVASNFAQPTRERLLVKLMWRPQGELVTLVSEFQFTTKDGVLFESRQVETYRPVECELVARKLKARRAIGQYGSSSSKLKLLIASPYRRTRLVFNGEARVRGSASEGKTQSEEVSGFLKFGCVITPVAEIFDFLELKQSKSAGRAYSDRHEQKVRFSGELALIEPSIRQPQERQTFSLRGFYSRHLWDGSCALPQAGIQTRRLYVYLLNGKSFHLALTRLRDRKGKRGYVGHEDGEEVNSTAEGSEQALIVNGYMNLSVLPSSEPLDSMSSAELRRVNDLFAYLTQNAQSVTPTSSCEHIELDRSIEIKNQRCDESLRCHIEKNFSGPITDCDWFDVEAITWLDGSSKAAPTPGWAWLSRDDNLDQPDSELIQESRAARQRAIEAGALLDLRMPVELNNSPLVVSISDSQCASSELVGSKAASLAHLRQLELRTGGFKVPQALVLTRNAYELVSKANPQIQEELQRLVRNELLEGLPTGERAQSVRRKCDELEALVERVALPQVLEEELFRRLKANFPRPIRLAVRSSSWGEDEVDMSAAGQLKTHLNVEFEPGRELAPITRAIMSCFASKFSYENVAYKRAHGLPLDMPMAVIVQEMISCDRAGVMFTCDPVTGDSRYVTITANFGLGESVVSAQADPDSIRVQRPHHTGGSFDIVHVHVGKKEVVIWGADQDGELLSNKSKCCLRNEEILQLARSAARLERYFSTRQAHCDIEFGLLAGQLYLLQCRPVTNLEPWSQEELLRESDRSPQTELVFYSRANVGEVMPCAVRPLTLTYSCFHWSVLNAQMLLEHRPIWGSRIAAARQVYSPQCGMIDASFEKWHAFLNLFQSNLMNMGEEQKSFQVRSLEIGVFGRELEPQRDIIEASRCFRPVPNPYAGFRFRLKTQRLRLDPKREIERIRVRIQRIFLQLTGELAAVSQQPPPNHSSSRLIELFDRMKSMLEPYFICWRVHLATSFLSSEANFNLNKLLARYIENPITLSTASNRFLSLNRDVISAEIPQRIKEMASLIKANGEASKFLEMNASEALGYLRGGSAIAQLKQKFRDFLERFGHRCYNEFDISFKMWREQPEQVVDMIKANCHPETMTANDETEANVKSFDKILDSIAGDLIRPISQIDRVRLKRLIVPRCQLWLASRERSKNLLIFYVGCQRLVTRLMAREMRRQLRLPDEELLYYLMFDELEMLCCEHRPTIVMQALRRRQLFKRMFPTNEVWKFDEVIRERDLIPHHLRPNVELDEALTRAPKLYGTPASPGKVRGKICLVGNYSELKRVEAGTILLTHSTDIAFSPVFPLINGIITEVGGLISHGAVVAREYGLPSVIGIPNVTQILRDGEEIILDANNGTILRLEGQKSDL